MLVHLGMTGKFFFINREKIKHKTSFYYDLNDDKDKKHDRIIFYLSNNQKLIYNDIRKFGFIKFIQRDNLNQNVFNISFPTRYIIFKISDIKFTT